MSWWHPNSPVSGSDGIIADGSIRAGKTFPMAISFIEWAFHFFEDQAFGMAGKTIGSFGRNVLFWLKPLLRKRGYKVKHVRNSDEGNYLDITNRKGKKNRFYVFGGSDERSQDLVQGVTLAGFLFDEVALMPQSFVNQATGRCSEEGAKFWFNCNPGSPSHWFKLEWLDKCSEKRLLHLHFTMADNPSLSADTRRRYESLYTGVFYKRMILGLWVMAEGAIFDMLDEANFYDELPLREHLWQNALHYIAVDYGTQNATVFGHFIDDGVNLWLDDEWYHSGKKTGMQKTDAQYVTALTEFCAGKPIEFVIIDPSAASFKVAVRQANMRVKDADNEVLDGIRLTSTVIGRRILRINRRCKNVIREMQSYVWDEKPTDKGNEKPLKVDDHGPDMVRYGVKTVYKPRRLEMLEDAA